MNAVTPPAPVESGHGDASVVRRLLGVFRREPMLLVTLGYVFVSVLGLWDSYWFYRNFDVPILQYLQSSDYFVSGLRRPEFLMTLLFVLLMSVLAMWPERWARRNPERAEQFRRRWWGRLLLPRRSDWWAYAGLHPETAMVLVAMAVMVVTLFENTGTRADVVRAGGGQPVSVIRAGPAWPTQHDMRVLGTSSAFVFLWSTQHQRAEIYPIEAISAIKAMQPAPDPVPEKPEAPPKRKPIPANPAVQAPAPTPTTTRQSAPTPAAE